MRDYAKGGESLHFQLDLTKESFIVIVVSSTGDGDPPENSARFLRRISDKNLKEDYFKGLTYAILGLSFFFEFFLKDEWSADYSCFFCSIS